MTDKVTKLIKGAVFGDRRRRLRRLRADLPAALARVGDLGPARASATAPWLGFLIVGVADPDARRDRRAALALRFIKKGSPPTPQLAIEEAQLIKGTLTANPAGHAGRRRPAAKDVAR